VDRDPVDVRQIVVVGEVDEPACMLTWVLQSWPSSTVRLTRGSCRMYSSRRLPASMFTRIRPSSSSRYQVATVTG
jgi:hypothetical protein